MNWNAFDLNLLLVFDAIMEERNLTRTGQRLGLSQSAVSHALGRLRHLLQDDLFVRTPDGMLPTPRAERMFQPIREALQMLRVTLEADEFKPSETSRTFTMIANNYAARAIVPAFIRHVRTLAPRVLIDVRPIGPSHMLDQLDSGIVDLALSGLTEGGERFKCVGLLDDDYVAVLSSGHPLANEPILRIEDFARLPHITITSGGENTQFVDDWLAEQGFDRLIWAKVPLHSLQSVLSASDALAVVPSRIATDLLAFCSLIARPLPFPSPRVSLSMIWHRRLDHDPAHRWLRATLRQSVKAA